jgi:RNA polymerase sigma-70 factor (sigma-E family)
VTFEQYAKRRLPALLVMARAMCTDSGLAEDLVQDVLIKVHARWASISATAEPDAYVHRMLVNEFVSWRRKWSRLIPHAEPAQLSATQRFTDDHPAAQAERDALLGEVRRLPVRQRAVIGLRYFADLSDAQIADALGCAQSTVRVHAARALSTLRVAYTEPTMAVTEGDAL